MMQCNVIKNRSSLDDKQPSPDSPPQSSLPQHLPQLNSLRKTVYTDMNRKPSGLMALALRVEGCKGVFRGLPLGSSFRVVTKGWKYIRTRLCAFQSRRRSTANL
jgi:hypothetical protein